MLGPTNTGKTHLAIERMLAHSSGIIGLPLRLLAREVYDRFVGAGGRRTGRARHRRGEDQAAATALLGLRPSRRCRATSTSPFSPSTRCSSAADLERGHVFTDRMLNRRGREETLVLGAADRAADGRTAAARRTRPHAAAAVPTDLCRREEADAAAAPLAVVAFSAEEVYAIAELIRRQRGGAAVVLGALSPRTRNAQVALYQSGDVEYLVATDAIGMGLNLDVDHVAFASDRKFDGYQFRKLNPAELAQIAGRAGRATRDGTFGTTGRCPPFETDLVQALESHSFEPVKVLQWRNTALDFSSLGALQASLAETPKENGLTRAPIAEDSGARACRA